MKRNLWQNFAGDLSIRKKLSLCFCLLLAIPMIVLSGNAISQATENIKQQNSVTMTNNLNSIVSELEYRFQREETYMKYLAYNLNFRDVLEHNSDDRTALALEMNNSVEPVLWYYIVSSDYIKGVDIFSSRIDASIGGFLHPVSECDNQGWYDMHETNRGNVWTFQDGKLYGSRVILDTGTMTEVLAVMRINFYDSVFSPLSDVDYLSNGVLVVDTNGEVICSKSSESKEIDKLVAADIAANPYLERNGSSEYFLVANEIPTTGWMAYYYVSKEKVNDQLVSMLNSTIVLIAVCLVVCLIVINAFSLLLSRRVLKLRDCAESVASGDLEQIITTDDTDEIGVVFNSIGEMARKLASSIEELYSMQLEMKAVELQVLQAQINPHFLYNCLSSIKWRAIKAGADDISELTGLLARFYRTSLNDGKQLTLVSKEMENIRAYVELQRMAHDFSFDAEYRIDEDTLELSMLNFLLQPIVENAIKHGIDQAEDGGRGLIEVECSLQDESIVFRVFNNGATTDTQTLLDIISKPGAGYGIHNIRERIMLYYGENSGVSAAVTEDGRTCFTLCILKYCQVIPEQGELSDDN